MREGGGNTGGKQSYSRQLTIYKRLDQINFSKAESLVYVSPGQCPWLAWHPQKARKTYADILKNMTYTIIRLTAMGFFTP